MFAFSLLLLSTALADADNEVGVADNEVPKHPAVGKEFFLYDRIKITNLGRGCAKKYPPGKSTYLGEKQQSGSLMSEPKECALFCEQTPECNSFEVQWNNVDDMYCTLSGVMGVHTCGNVAHNSWGDVYMYESIDRPNKFQWFDDKCIEGNTKQAYKKTIDKDTVTKQFAEPCYDACKADDKCFGFTTRFASSWGSFSETCILGYDADISTGYCGLMSGSDTTYEMNLRDPCACFGKNACETSGDFKGQCKVGATTHCIFKTWSWTAFSYYSPIPCKGAELAETQSLAYQSTAGTTTFDYGVSGFALIGFSFLIYGATQHWCSRKAQEYATIEV